ncbi:hypothetical protein P4686_10395 [Terribacillus saccharophilus]|nr:hypothetical protein [Terribacillus saccharophilus]
MYAIVGYFDEVTESKIVKLWEELRETAITDYPYRRKGHRPHLTFSSFTEFNPDLLQKIDQLTSLYEAITLRFRLFGSFMKSDSFLLLPDPSSMLTNLHQKIQPASCVFSLCARKLDSAYDNRQPSESRSTGGCSASSQTKIRSLFRYLVQNRTYTNY